MSTSGSSVSAMLKLETFSIHAERTAFRRFPPPPAVFEFGVYWAVALGVAAIAFMPWFVALSYGPTVAGLVFVVITRLQGLKVVVDGLAYLYAAFRIKSRVRSIPDLDLDVTMAVLVPIYKEDFDIVKPGLATMNQSRQAKNLIVLIAMEARAPNNEKLRSQIESLMTKVREIRFYEHPTGIPGDLPGAASNCSYAMGEFRQELFSDCVNFADWGFVKLDAQVIPHPRFFCALAQELDAWKHHRRAVTWTPPVVHAIHSNAAYGIGSAYALMIETETMGSLYWLNFYPFGQYGMPLEQYFRAGTHHPSYVPEDELTMDQCKWTNQYVPLESLWVPVIKAPPMGNSFWEAFEETVVQQRRFFGGSLWALPLRAFYAPGSMLWKALDLAVALVIRVYPQLGFLPAGIIAYSLQVAGIIEMPSSSALVESFLPLVLQVALVCVLLPMLQNMIITTMHAGEVFSIHSIIFRAVAGCVQNALITPAMWLLTCQIMVQGRHAQSYRPRKKFAQVTSGKDGTTKAAQPRTSTGGEISEDDQRLPLHMNII